MRRRLRSIPLGCAVIGAILSARIAPARDVDDAATLAVHQSTSAAPGKVVPTELRIVGVGSSSRRGFSVVQAEPVQPGAASDRPPRPAMPTSREPEEEYLIPKPIGEVTATTTIKTAGVMDPDNVVPKDWAKPYFAKFGELAGPAVENRSWGTTGYFWLAPGLGYWPLYFEEINVERYGYRVGCLQPAISAAHFFATIPLMPYKTFVHPPHECVYSLGYYRPGDCAPCQHEQVHVQLDAAAAEAGLISGMILLFTH
jgi:hypothetical protein